MFRLLICACVVSALFLAEGEAQVLGVGNCSAVEVVQDFNATKYTGLWYEYKRYPLVFEFLGKCVTATYTAQSDGKIGVFNEQINALIGNKQEINGTATFDGPSNVAKLTVTFPTFFSVKGSYWVLGTDYTSYAVVWSCTPFGFITATSSWILTRDANPSQATINKANEIINKNKIPSTHYGLTDQTNCPNRS